MAGHARSGPVVIVRAGAHPHLDGAHHGTRLEFEATAVRPARSGDHQVRVRATHHERAGRRGRSGDQQRAVIDGQRVGDLERRVRGDERVDLDVPAQLDPRAPAAQQRVFDDHHASLVAEGRRTREGLLNQRIGTGVRMEVADLRKERDVGGRRVEDLDAPHLRARVDPESALADIDATGIDVAVEDVQNARKRAGGRTLADLEPIGGTDDRMDVARAVGDEPLTEKLARSTGSFRVDGHLSLERRGRRTPDEDPVHGVVLLHLGRAVHVVDDVAFQQDRNLVVPRREPVGLRGRGEEECTGHADCERRTADERG